MHLHGENVTTPEEGARIARVRAEELKARKLVFRGAGRSCFLRAGYTFALEDHPRAGVDGAYLVTELEHRGGGGHAEARELLGGDADEGYRVDVVAIPASVQFRPERRTPVPRIYGMEGAVIDGEADTDYAQLDEHGRYLVKMRFDESAAKDGKASARIRMMQPHGGSPESFHFPLRKGTEVLLAFEGGDPDRPVIAGVVPNAVTPSLVSSRNATKNILMTGGGNRLIIEDEKGKEYIHLATPHKRTFLHMGSTFNPQYNHIKNTDGTSLSYTTQLSTSVRGRRQRDHRRAGARHGHRARRDGRGRRRRGRQRGGGAARPLVHRSLLDEEIYADDPPNQQLSCVARALPRATTAPPPRPARSAAASAPRGDTIATPRVYAGSSSRPRPRLHPGELRVPARRIVTAVNPLGTDEITRRSRTNAASVRTGRNAIATFPDHARRPHAADQGGEHARPPAAATAAPGLPLEAPANLRMPLLD